MFSNEKCFDVDGMYYRQNYRIWAPDRETADKNGRIYRKTKYLQGVMIWLGLCYVGVIRPVIIEKRTINRQIYIKKIYLIDSIQR